MGTTPRGQRGQFAKGAGRWKKGQKSPNPTGRPKGVGAYIREKAKGGHELVDVLLSIVRNKRIDPKKRTDAVRELFDRGWGKPVQVNAIKNLDDFQTLAKLVAEKTREALGDEAYAKIVGALQAIPEAELDALEGDAW